MELIRTAPIGSGIIVQRPPRARAEGAVAEEVDVAADKTYTGSCLCGAVRFATPALSDIWYCHCRQCQKLTGLYIAAAGAPRDTLDIKGPVNWLPISAKSKSGHCEKCGCYMFWDRQGQATISVLAGCLDDTDGVTVKGHIFVASKGDYYEITDGLPQYMGYPPGGTRQRDETNEE